MQLPRDGVEYARIRFFDLPVGASVEASLNRTTWTGTEPGADDLERLFLLRGPDATGTQGQLVAGRSTIYVRVLDDPERIVRKAGEVSLY